MFIEINGNNIYYEIHGTGIPIISLHGYRVDHNLMKGFIEKIIPQDNYQRIYFDLPGMGNTKINNSIPNAEKMFETIQSFIRKINGNNKYILIGESYGGYLLRKLIKDEPQNILGAMFVCPVILPDQNERTLPERKIIYNDIVDKNTIESELYKSYMECVVFSTKETLKNFECNVFSGLKKGDDDFLTEYHEKGYSFTENIDEIKEPFDNPTLFIAAKQDHIVGYKDINKILDNYSRASVCIIDEAGHNVEIEKIKIIEVLTLDWLERIQRYDNAKSKTKCNK